MTWQLQVLAVWLGANALLGVFNALVTDFKSKRVESALGVVFNLLGLTLLLWGAL